MELVRKAEASLGDLFKSLPALPAEWKEFLVKIVPWLALIGGIVQLGAAWSLYTWASSANSFINYTNELSRAMGGETVASGFSVFVYASLIILAIEAVLMLVAVPKLLNRQKSGWDLLFLAGLVSLLYAVVSLFMDYRGGFGGLFGALVSSAIGFYILFQIREKYLAATKQ